MDILKRIIGLILIVIPFCKVLPDNFKPLNYQRTAYFNSLIHQIQAISVDSVFTEGSDSVIRFFNNIQLQSPSCYTPEGASWMGVEMRLKVSGEVIFKNKKGLPRMNRSSGLYFFNILVNNEIVKSGKLIYH